MKYKRSKKVLIATRNEDKFIILRELLTASGLVNVSFYNLRDLGISSQITEVGNVANRAYLKAQEAYSKLKDSDELIDIYVGSDDAMQIPNGNIRVDSKEVTEEILNNNLLNINEILTIVRAFSFIDKHGTELSRFETKIPFKFIGNLNKVKKMIGKYPLNYVLSPVNSDMIVADMSGANSISYYMEFCEDVLRSKLKEII